MLANELIDRLERLGLLDQEIIEALREQLEQGGTRVTPEAVAKLLVDNGQLTHFQATKLIGELRSGQYDSAADSGEDLTSGFDDLDVLPDEEAVEVVAEVEAVPVYEAEPVAAVADASPMGQGMAPPVPTDRPKPHSQEAGPAEVGLGLIQGLWIRWNHRDPAADRCWDLVCPVA